MNPELLKRLSEISQEEKRILSGEAVDMQLYSQKQSGAVDGGRFLQGKMIDIRTHTRFAAFPRHNHDYVEMMYVCQGSVTHRFDKKDITLKAGELLLLGCNTCHEILPAGKDDIGVNFLVRPSFFHTAFDMMEEENSLSDFIINSLSGAGSSDEYMYFEVAESLPVQNIVENLIYSLCHQHKGEDKINEITMGLLFLRLMKDAHRQQTGGDTPRALAFRALSYIDAYYVNATLRDFSAQNNLPEYTVSRTIKTQLGTSFRSLLMERRFSAALNLLCNTKMSVAEIIAAVGYENSSYFYRIFQQKHGCTPQEYRTGIKQ